jgi:hypothetical protein
VLEGNQRRRAVGAVRAEHGHKDRYAEGEAGLPDYVDDRGAGSEGAAVARVAPGDRTGVAGSVMERTLGHLSSMMQLTNLSGAERKSFTGMDCSVAQCLEAVGQWWSLLIVRDIFLGVTGFDEILWGSITGSGLAGLAGWDHR